MQMISSYGVELRKQPDPTDTGDLPVCSQLPDRNIWTDMERAGRDPGGKETF